MFGEKLAEDSDGEVNRLKRLHAPANAELEVAYLRNYDASRLRKKSRKEKKGAKRCS